EAGRSNKEETERAECLRLTGSPPLRNLRRGDVPLLDERIDAARAELGASLAHAGPDLGRAEPVQVAVVHIVVGAELPDRGTVSRRALRREEPSGKQDSNRAHT